MSAKTPAIVIAALHLEQEVGRGAHTVVYRARHGDLVVAVKVDAQQEAWVASDASARFRREAGVLARVRHPALPAVLEIGQAGGRAYIVMEYVDGVTLSRRIADGALPEAEIVAIARTLASALAALHRHGIIHRDVKPDNVILDATGVRLIDVGLAGPVAGTLDGGDFAGSLLYSAPEQSGVLRRAVDARSDLYALGCVLFECAVRRPPFESRNVAELLRQHASAIPREVAELNPQISPTLSAVIARLLAKDPDDRYQSAAGLLSDLDRLDTLNTLHLAGQGFALGQHDAPADAPEELPLVGRDAELRQLQTAWSAALRGRVQIALIEGEPGGGKSRLARELLRHARGRGGLVLVGRCAESSRTPLAPIRSALEGWIRRIPEPERAEATSAVTRAASDLAPFLRRLSPALAAMLPTSPAADRASDGQEQFYGAVADFLRGVARARGGAVLLIDDVQWLDESTHEVVKRLAMAPGSAPLLVLCTGRNDSSSRAQLARFVDDVGDRLTTRLALARLDDRAIGHLVIEHLDGQVPDEAVVRQIVARADGNPLAVGELMRAMLDAGILRPYWGSWRVDDAGLERIDLSADVMALILQRLDRLGGATQAVLSGAAIIGSHFRVDLLRTVCSAKGIDVLAVIAEALAVHLIERVDDGSYAFVHDRVREALLSRVADSARRTLHQRVAVAVDAMPFEDTERLYALASHYVSGEVASNPGRAYAACVAAGNAAVDNFADQEAYSFLAEAHRLAAEYGLPVDLELSTRLGDVCARLGRWSEAIEHIEAALGRSEEAVQRARLRSRLTLIYMANRDGEPAWQQAQRAFADLRVTCPRVNLLHLLMSLWQLLLGILIARTGIGYGRASGALRARLICLAQLYEAAAFTGYLLSNRLLVAQMMMRSLYTAGLLGPTRELAVTYIGLGLVLGIVGWASAADRSARAGIRISQAIGDRFTLARALAGQAWAQHVGGRPRQAAALSRSLLDQHGQWLDAHAYVIGCADLAWNLLMRGYCREALDWVERAMRRAEASSRQTSSLASDAAALQAVLGETREARTYLTRAREVADAVPGELWRRSDLLGFAVLFHLEQGELGTLLEDSIAQHRALGLLPHTASFHERHFYVFQAYARLAQCLGPSGSDQAGCLDRLGAALRELRRAGRHPTLRCHATVVEAAHARLRGRARKAERLLARAERLADAIDAPWPLFEIARQRAHLLADRGDRAASLRQAGVALGLANQHGWINRAGWIRSEFQVESTVGITDSPFDSNASRIDLRAERPRRHLEALQAVSLATATVFDPDEQAKVALDEVVRLMGAERAFLFLCDGRNGLQFKAGRDAAGNDLPELSGYSRTIVDSVLARREPLVVSSADAGPVAPSESMIAHDLRSVAASPLLMQDRPVGVLYLDNRLARGVFGKDDLAILTAIGGQIAIATETANAFARQAALMGENADLLATVRAQLAELRQSRSRVAAAEERLRREIGELLHSRVQTRLLVAWHRLGQCTQLIASDPAAARKLLTEVREEIDRIREQEIRQASHQLHPAVIRIGLLAALRSLAGRFEDQFAISIDADPGLVRLDDPADNRIPEPLRLVAYRVVEESLSNVSRHAGAGAVALRAWLDAGALCLAIRDDGAGFDPRQRSDGLGLTSIATRVEQAGGEWGITSVIGEGTTVTLRLPLGLIERPIAAG